MRRLLALAALVLLPTTAPTPASAHPCGNAWATAVHHRTDLTCAEARWLYRRRPTWRDEMPTSEVAFSWASGPSPAFRGQRSCIVTTTEKYRAPVLPFGDQVLFSARMSQEFWYDGTRVTVGEAELSIDTTGWGWRWQFDGFDTQDFYSLTPWHWQHTSQKWVHFSTDGVLKLGSVHSTIHVSIRVQADGDWSTDNAEGRPGCQNS